MLILGKIAEALPAKLACYMIRLNNDCAYVGLSLDVERRVKEHLSDSEKSSEWCRLNGALELVSFEHHVVFNRNQALMLEDYYMFEATRMFDIDKIRGGRYSYVRYPPKMEILQKVHFKWRDLIESSDYKEACRMLEDGSLSPAHKFIIRTPRRPNPGRKRMGS